MADDARRLCRPAPREAGRPDHDGGFARRPDGDLDQEAVCEAALAHSIGDAAEQVYRSIFLSFDVGKAARMAVLEFNRSETLAH